MTAFRTAFGFNVLAGLLAASGCVPDATLFSASARDAGVTTAGGSGGAAVDHGGHGGQGLGGYVGHGGQGSESCVPACGDAAEPDCETTTCFGGACTSTYEANGTKLPHGKQTPANCRVNVCDGAGKAVDQTDDADLPNDANDCTTDTCTDGVPMNEPVAAGTPCANGAQVCDAAWKCVACNVDANCKDPVKPSCDANQCVPLGCMDGKQNGNETDVDCGGSCAGCEANQVCGESADCLSQVCASLKCAAPTCKDGIANGAETDVDCGGSCAGCGPSQKCSVSVDCLGKQCDVATHTCAPTCSDGVKNNAETSMDCGGGTCGKCADGMACRTAADCSANGCCNAPAGTCSPCCDGVKNHGETGIDCGGSCANKCADGTPCTGNGDCLSALCQGFACTPSNCSNGSKDVGETDIDCGGPCQPCTQGKLCGGAADCAAGFCTDGVCCNAGCGGLCEACIKTKTGLADGDCQPVLANSDSDADCAQDAAAGCKQNGMCDGNRACAKYDNVTVCAASSCAAGVQTASSRCNGAGVCLAGAGIACAPYVCGANACNSTCVNDSECNAADYCDVSGNPKVCRPTVVQGGACSANGQCQNDTCVDGVCCDTVCVAACQACANGLTGAPNGTCHAITAGTDPQKECGLGGGAEMCGADGKCQCADGAKNASETGIDCGGPTCAKCAAGQGCGAGSDCLSGLCVAGKCASLPGEVCNFVDDNKDGQVDEGFDWTIGSFAKLFATQHGAGVTMALTLANGSVVVAADDGSDRALLFRTDGTGKVLDGPLSAKVSTKAVRAHVITETNDRIAQVISSTNYAGCNSGCPVQLRTYTKAPLSADSSVTLAFGFDVSYVSDIAWTGSALAMWVVEPDGTAHVVWVSKAGMVLKDQSLAALGRSPGEAGKVAITASGVTWSATYGKPGAGWLYTGTFSLDGATTVVPPTVLVVANNPSPPRVEGVLAGPSASAILPYFDDIASSAAHVLRVVTGVVVAGPQAYGLSGDTPRSTVNVDVNFVSLVTSAANMRAYRFRRDTLALVPTPGAAASSAYPHDALTLASVAGGMLIFRANDSAGEVSVARVGCK